MFDILASKKPLTLSKNLLPLVRLYRCKLSPDFCYCSLCHVCFTRAKEYAQANSFDAAIEIVLDDRVIGTETKLTCADVERMEAVPLEKMDVAQLEPFSDSAMIADEELQTALRLSLGEPRSEGNEPISQTEAQAYDDFVSFVFSGMVSLVSSHLMKGGRNQRLAPVLRVCLDLIRNSANSGTTCDRARQFAKEMKMGISHLLLDGRSAGGIVSNDSLWSIISCLRAAQFLLVPNEADPASIIENLQGEEDSKARENPEVLCDMHQIPAVRRRSAKGKNKDRRFYVCGRERGQRCTFFRWADELEGRQVTKLKISPLLKKVVLENLWGENVKESVPLHIALCRFLEAEIFEHRDAVEVPVERLGQRLEKTTAGGRLASLYDDASFLRDVADGVICSREKLQDVCRGHAQADDPSHNNAFQLDLFGTRDPKKHLLEAALVLVALVADYKTPGITRWFSLLCEIENSSNFKESRGLACKVLKLLCGKERALFHSVRDHFSFGFQFRALFRTAAPLLETAILVSERARVCGAHWTASAKLEWDSLSYGGLIGCDYLISDNDYPEPRLRSIGKILDDLIAVVRNGTESWRRFCGHTTLPPFHRDPKRTSPDHAFAEKMARLPPIVVLFWAACSLSGVNQVKAFRLIGMALTRTQGGLNFDIGEMSDGQTDTAIMVAISGAASSAPESLLLSTAKQLSVEDMSVFVLHFVLAGASSELRRACHLFALKIAVDIPRRERTALFTKLLSSKFLGIGEYGRSSTEFLNFLQGLAPDLDPLSSLEEYGDLILDSFIDQMEALKYDGSNEKWAIIENCHRHVPVLKKKLHLTDCLHCFRTKHTSGNKGDKDDPCTTGPSKRVAITRAASRQAKKWRPEQVSVFSRQRVDSIRAGSSSNEFNTYYLLRHRVVIGDIYLTVSDPRGRFVKGVTIYYSPHPAKDASVLKSDEYAPKWQKCATMVLPRGASRASANLAYSVVAANLRIEYTDFYERPGGSKASDGSPLVHCPRCTRGT
jgi:GRF zinc finger